MKKFTEKIHLTILCLALLTFLSIAFGAYFYYASLTKFAHFEAHHQVDIQIKSITNRINVFLAEQQRSVKAMSGINRLRLSLLEPNAINLRESNSALEHFQKSLDVDVCYLLDKQGMVIASSNRNEPDSFVGINITFRPYFKNAIEGVPTTYMALGITSQKRGLYCSYPIYQLDGGTPIGVVVIKVGMTRLDHEFSKAPEGILLLTDPNGVIFISSRTEWLFKTMGQLSENEIEQIRRAKQYGDSPALQWAGISWDQGNAQAKDAKGNSYLIHHFEVTNHPGWQLIYMRDQGIVSQKIADKIFRSAGYTILAICCSTILLVIFLYLFAVREIHRRLKTEELLAKAHAEKEKQILEKTRDLSLANEKLLQEIDNRLLADQTLDENKTRFQELFNNMSSGVMVLATTDEGEHFKIIDVNRAAEWLDSFEKEKIVGNDLDQVLPNINTQTFANMLKRVWTTGKSEYLPTTATNAEGIISSREYYIYKMASSELITVCDDVTEQKRAEEQVAASAKIQTTLNKLLSLSLENLSLPQLFEQFLRYITNLPWLDLEKRGAIFLINNEAENQLVMVAQAGLSEYQLIACATVPFGRCLCGKAALSDTVIFTDRVNDLHENTYEHMPAHGHYCVPIRSKAGKILGVFTLYTREGAKRNSKIEEFLMAAAHVAANIIVHKQDEDALLREKNTLTSVFAAMADGVTVQNTNFKILYQNPVHKRMQGDHIGELCFQAFHHRETPCMSCVLAKTFKDGRIHRHEKNIVTRRGLTTIEVVSSPIFDAQGRIIAGIEVVRDITINKKMAVHLQQKQKMESIGTLAGGVAHDFNNMLAAILGFTDLSLNSIEPDHPLTGNLKEVLAAGQRAKQLVDQILAFSREVEQEFKPILPLRPVYDALSLLRASIPTTIEIRQDLAPDCAAILADPNDLHQILMNLCANAAYAMRDKGGILTVKLENILVDCEMSEAEPTLSEGRYVRLTVQDTGAGIPPEVINRIFEPFFTTKDVGSGSGMGLAVVHGIVTGMGGTILVNSEPGTGTTFQIYLPTISMKPAEKTVHSELAVTGSENILFVDDEDTLTRLGQAMLESLGYQVTARTSSIEALEFFRAYPDKFDLIITDYAMPNMNGAELAKAIFEIRPEMPIILITGFSETFDAEQAKSIGIREYVLKPIIRNNLSAIIRKVLDQNQSLSEN